MLSFVEALMTQIVRRAISGQRPLFRWAQCRLLFRNLRVIHGDFQANDH
jgi:hypothetical protein